MTAISRRVLLFGASAAALEQVALAEASVGVFALDRSGGGGGQPAFSGVSYKPLVAAGEQGLAVSIANDGTTVFAVNSSSPWLWSGSSWKRLCTPSTMPRGTFSTTGGPANYEGLFVAIAPTNSQYMVMMGFGKYFYTSNQGRSWTASSLTYPSGTTYNSIQSPIIQFDPVNPGNVIACVPGTGAYYSTNSGATWTAVSGVPTGEPVYIVCFDPSTSTGVSTPGIYVGAQGNGFYHTTGGVTGTFSLLSGNPTTSVWNAACSSDGYLYCVSGYGTNSDVYIYNGSWTTVSVGGGGYNTCGIAVDPLTTGRVIAFQNGGARISASTNHGNTWGGWTSSLTQCSFSATDVPWLNSSGLAAGIQATGFTGAVQGIFHPTISNLVYVACGTGCYTIQPSNSSSSANIVWTSQNAGLGMLDSFQIISPPGTNPITAQWDRAVFPVYPVPGPAQSYVPNDNGGNLYQGYSIDWAPNSSVIVGLTEFVAFTSGSDAAGYSLDGGQTWNVFTGSVPAGPTGGGGGWGGDIAAGSTTNFIRVQSTEGSNTNALYYTTNQGGTWTAASGLPTTGWKANFYQYGHYLCADKVNSGTFYCVNASTNYVYASTNKGKSWIVVNTSSVSVGLNSDLQSVPGSAGHLFHCQCAGSDLQYSTNRGATWSNVSNVRGVYAYGFGAPYAGYSYPTIYIAGEVGRKYSIWRGIGDSPSSLRWTNLAAASPAGYPKGTGWHVLAISGDNTAFGWFYIGWQLSGYLYGVSNDAAPWGCFTSPRQSSTISGTVNLTVAVAADIDCTSVQFQVDGVNAGDPITSSGLRTATYSYNTSGVASGPHTISAVLTGNGQTTIAKCYVTK